ncbi:MAG: nucleotidyl transferase AbiEii/AbiGii toxin family protein [Chitinophagaceae bacterium]
MKIPAIYIEKNYWITYALFTIFNDKIGEDTLFKGGTALTKCYNMIERFSEDIDLVVLRRDGETDNKLKTKLKTISALVETTLPEVAIAGITRKMGMNRKTAHAYDKAFDGNYGQVRDVIVLESTWLGYYEPYTTKSIASFVGNMMLTNGRTVLAKEKGLLPFGAYVLIPTRTICEKIMSLVRFSYGENPIEDLKKKIRHTYDLHQLLGQPEFSEFFYSPAFGDMMLKVANNDVLSFRNNNKWLNHHPSDALMFMDLGNVWKELKVVYDGDFRNLVYGDFPKESDVLGTLNMIQERLKTVSWTIKVEA